MNRFFYILIAIVITICFVGVASCFSSKQQSSISQVNTTIDRWSPYKKYAGVNNEIILGPYRSKNKPDPDYDPELNKGKDHGVLNLIFRHKQTTTEEKYYLLQCMSENDTAFMSYGLKYSFTEDKRAIIPHPKNGKTNIINESYVITGTIRTNLNDDAWEFKIGPYAIRLKSKSDSNYYKEITGYIKTTNQKTIDPIPIGLNSPLLENKKLPLGGISFVTGGHLAAMEFSPGCSVSMKKNIPPEYRLIIAAICSAMYDLRGSD